MKTLTIDQAARRLDISKTEVRTMIDRRVLGVHWTPAAAIPEGDVTAVLRDRETKERQSAIADARAPIYLAARIAEEERFLRGIGCSSSPRLEALREELAQREATRKSSHPTATATASKRAAEITASFESSIARRERRPTGTFATRVRTLSGLEHRRIYDCRHTFATWAIEDGIALWHLATIMGTSVVQIEDTYARWLKRTDDALRAAFDAYDEQRAAS